MDISERFFNCLKLSLARTSVGEKNWPKVTKNAQMDYLAYQYDILDKKTFLMLSVKLAKIIIYGSIDGTEKKT